MGSQMVEDASSNLVRNSGNRFFPTHKEIIISTDASGKKGIGSFWFEQRKCSRPGCLADIAQSISISKKCSLYFVFAEWCDFNEWRGAEIIVKCDNDAVVDGLNKKSISGPAIEPLQTLLLLAASRDIVVRATWIPTEENEIADALIEIDWLIYLAYRSSLPSHPGNLRRLYKRSLASSKVLPLPWPCLQYPKKHQWICSTIQKILPTNRENPLPHN